MKTVGFTRVYTDKKTFVIIEKFENGETREVSPDYIGYKVWKGDIESVPWTPVKSSVLKEQKWAQVRAMRDALLKECDWTQLADSKVADDWKEYRQILRDVPQNNKTPEKALKALQDLKRPGEA